MRIAVFMRLIWSGVKIPAVLREEEIYDKTDKRFSIEDEELSF